MNPIMSLTASSASKSSAIAITHHPPPIVEARNPFGTPPRPRHRISSSSISTPILSSSRPRTRVDDVGVADVAEGGGFGALFDVEPASRGPEVVATMTPGRNRLFPLRPPPPLDDFRRGHHPGGAAVVPTPGESFVATMSSSSSSRRRSVPGLFLDKENSEPLLSLVQPSSSSSKPSSGYSTTTPSRLLQRALPVMNIGRYRSPSRGRKKEAGGGGLDGKGDDDGNDKDNILRTPKGGPARRLAASLGMPKSAPRPALAPFVNTVTLSTTTTTTTTPVRSSSSAWIGAPKSEGRLLRRGRNHDHDRNTTSTTPDNNSGSMKTTAAATTGKKKRPPLVSTPFSNRRRSRHKHGRREQRLTPPPPPHTTGPPTGTKSEGVGSNAGLALAYDDDSSSFKVGGKHEHNALRTSENDPSPYQMEKSSLDELTRCVSLCSILDAYAEVSPLGTDFDFMSLAEGRRIDESDAVLLRLRDAVGDDVVVEGFFRYYTDRNKFSSPMGGNAVGGGGIEEGRIGERVEALIVFSQRLRTIFVAFRGNTSAQERPVTAGIGQFVPREPRHCLSLATLRLSILPRPSPPASFLIPTNYSLSLSLSFSLNTPSHPPTHPPQQKKRTPYP